MACQKTVDTKTKKVGPKSSLANPRVKNDLLFKLEIDKAKNSAKIKAPANSGFAQDENAGDTEISKIADFNSDGKEDVLLNLGECGTGGCMYGIFLNRKADTYEMAFYDYLKNPEFLTEKDGSISIESSEEIEPYDPSKLHISIFK